MKFLAVDFGLAKIGLAVSEGDFAQPLSVLRVKGKKDAKTKLTAVARNQSIERLIFGRPDPDSIGAVGFAEDLAESLNLPLAFVDETMSTKIVSKGKRNRKAKMKEDSTAAALLLQEYLEQGKEVKLAI